MRPLVYITVLILLGAASAALADGFIAVGGGGVIIGFGGGCRPLPPGLMGPQYWGGPPVLGPPIFGGSPIFGGPQLLPPPVYPQLYGWNTLPPPTFCPQPYGWGAPAPGFLPGQPDNWRVYTESGPRGRQTSGWARGHDPRGGTWRYSFDNPRW